MTFGGKLKQIRTHMGFASARAFYLFLSQKSELPFNYSYYMQVEKDSKLPSAKFVSEISLLISEPLSEELILAYCSALFPTANVFTKLEASLVPPKTAVPKMNADKPEKPQTTPAQLVGGQQKVLSERQVALVAKSREHYFLFLILTLARTPLAVKDLSNFGFTEVMSTLRDLQDAKLGFLDEANQLVATYHEWAFPKPTNKSIEADFKKLDEYDKDRNRFFQFEKLRKTEMFRRISPKYIALIQQNLELLLQTIRTADETDTRQNSEVFSLSLHFFKGQLPG